MIKKQREMAERSEARNAKLFAEVSQILNLSRRKKSEPVKEKCVGVKNREYDFQTPAH